MRRKSKLKLKKKARKKNPRMVSSHIQLLVKISDLTIELSI